MRYAIFACLATASKGFIHPSHRSGSMVKLAAGVIDAPFGAWESPITSKAITSGSVGIGSLKLDTAGNLLWLEGRPQEGGRYALCRYDPSSSSKSDRNAVDITPKDSNVRTRVHEYGGGAVTLGSDGEVFYSDFADQRVMKLAKGGEDPVAITPDNEDARYRFADGFFDAQESRLYMVREDHTDPAPKDVVNEIVYINPNSSDDIKVVAKGNDFYSNPRLSSDGTKLAYITWQHPNMPWDSTELRVATMDDSFSAETSSHQLIAGEDGDTSVIQPMFHPSGDLFYISDETGYYNIYRTDSDGKKTSVLPMDFDFGGASPGWVFGQQGYTFLPDGRLAATYKKDGSTRLIIADVRSDGPAKLVEEYSEEDGLPMQFGGVIASGDDLYFLGGSPSTPPSVFKWSLDKRGEAEQLACSSTLSFSDDTVSVPKQIEFPTKLGTAFGYYYAPKNGRFTCTTDSAPPLLVKAHGGPTSCTGTSFNAGKNDWV